MRNVFAPHKVFLAEFLIFLEHKNLIFLFYSHFLLHVVVPCVRFPPPPPRITIRHHRINIKMRFLLLDFEYCCKDKDTPYPNKAIAIILDIFLLLYHLKKEEIITAPLMKPVITF